MTGKNQIPWTTALCDANINSLRLNTLPPNWSLTLDKQNSDTLLVQWDHVLYLGLFWDHLADPKALQYPWGLQYNIYLPTEQFTRFNSLTSTLPTSSRLGKDLNTRLTDHRQLAQNGDIKNLVAEHLINNKQIETNFTWALQPIP